MDRRTKKVQEREREETKKILDSTTKRGRERDGKEEDYKDYSLPSIRDVISHWLLIPHYHLQKHSSTCQENAILLQSFSQ
jgi:hypothetical protein